MITPVATHVQYTGTYYACRHAETFCFFIKTTEEYLSNKTLTARNVVTSYHSGPTSEDDIKELLHTYKTTVDNKVNHLSQTLSIPVSYQRLVEADQGQAEGLVEGESIPLGETTPLDAQTAAWVQQELHNLFPPEVKKQPMFLRNLGLVSLLHILLSGFYFIPVLLGFSTFSSTPNTCAKGSSASLLLGLKSNAVT